MKTQKDLMDAQRRCGNNITVISFNLETNKRVMTYSKLSFAQAMSEIISQPYRIFHRVYKDLPYELSAWDYTDTEKREQAQQFQLAKDY